MSNNRLNAIVILDAVPDGELNTARRLREDLEDIASFRADGLQVRYARVQTPDHVEVSLSAVLRDTRETGLLPLLHLEGHGCADESGFALPDGKHCDWSKLKELITPLNVAMGLNLMLVMATCYGGSFARAIRTTDRAPLWGLIGPTGEVKAGQVQGDFGAFYRTFFETLSDSKAVEALNANAPKGLYYLTTAERFFYNVWRGYKQVLCSEGKIAERARDMFRRAKAEHLPMTPSVGQLKRTIRSTEEHLFERYRDTYFMYDLYPSNRSRFPVTHKEAEAYAAR